MKILSLFDGISCGQVALNRSGITDYTYYASEVEKEAIKVTQHHFPNTIQLGDVTKVHYKDGVLYSENGHYPVGKIDLLIGGSPCTGFSSVGKGLDFDDPQSKLFLEYERILREVKPTYFMLENVKMREWCEKVITDYLKVSPIIIDSSLVSAQNRKRLYWTNIPLTELPTDRGIVLQDILEESVDSKYYIKNRQRSIAYVLNKYNEFVSKKGYFPKIFNPYNCREVQEKSPTLTSNGTRISTSSSVLVGEDLDNVRQLTPLEWERLQTLPDNYTSILADTHRFNAIGNGWTVDVIAHIFKGLVKQGSPYSGEKQLVTS